MRGVKTYVAEGVAVGGGSGSGRHTITIITATGDLCIHVSREIMLGLAKTIHQTHMNIVDEQVRDYEEAVKGVAK